MEKTKNSFSTRFKQEILQIKANDEIDIISELYGLFLSKDAYNEGIINFKTEISYVARRIYENLKKLDKLFFSYSCISGKKSISKNLYCIKIEKQKEILESLFSKEMKKELILKGFFIGTGYIKDPLKGHSIDFFLDNEKSAMILYNILKEMNKKVFISKKKNKNVVYVRNIEDILDILIELEGVNLFFEYQEVAINKEITLKITRNMNFEIANETKMLVTSAEQIHMIKTIDQKIGLNKISNILRETAILRLENEEASLKELALKLNITKSGIRNRFRRLKEIYDELNDK